MAFSLDALISQVSQIKVGTNPPHLDFDLSNVFTPSTTVEILSKDDLDLLESCDFEMLDDNPNRIQNKIMTSNNKITSKTKLYQPLVVLNKLLIKLTSIKKPFLANQHFTEMLHRHLINEFETYEEYSSWERLLILFCQAYSANIQFKYFEQFKGKYFTEIATVPLNDISILMTERSNVDSTFSSAVKRQSHQLLEVRGYDESYAILFEQKLQDNNLTTLSTTLAKEIKVLPVFAQKGNGPRVNIQINSFLKNVIQNVCSWFDIDQRSYKFIFERLNYTIRVSVNVDQRVVIISHAFISNILCEYGIKNNIKVPKCFEFNDTKFKNSILPLSDELIINLTRKSDEFLVIPGEFSTRFGSVSVGDVKYGQERLEPYQPKVTSISREAIIFDPIIAALEYTHFVIGQVMLIEREISSYFNLAERVDKNYQESVMTAFRDPQLDKIINSQKESLSIINVSDITKHAARCECSASAIKSIYESDSSARNVVPHYRSRANISDKQSYDTPAHIEKIEFKTNSPDTKTMTTKNMHMIKFYPQGVFPYPNSPKFDFGIASGCNARFPFGIYIYQFSNSLLHVKSLPIGQSTVNVILFVGLAAVTIKKRTLESSVGIVVDEMMRPFESELEKEIIHSLQCRLRNVIPYEQCSFATDKAIDVIDIALLEKYANALLLLNFSFQNRDSEVWSYQSLFHELYRLYLYNHVQTSFKNASKNEYASDGFDYSRLVQASSSFRKTLEFCFDKITSSKRHGSENLCFFKTLCDLSTNISNCEFDATKLYDLISLIIETFGSHSCFNMFYLGKGWHTTSNEAYCAHSRERFARWHSAEICFRACKMYQSKYKSRSKNNSNANGRSFTIRNR